MSSKLLLFATVLIGLSGISIAAEQNATIRFVPGEQGSQNVRFNAHVEVSGELTKSSPSQLKLALETAKQRTPLRTLGGAPGIHVYLNSPGGDVFAAMMMGSLLRSFGAEAWVVPGSTCASACVLVFAGGVERSLFDRARLVVHRPYFDPSIFAGLSQAEAQAKYTSMASTVREYLSSMGVDDGLFQQMMRVPSHDALDLTEQQATELNLVGQDPAFAEWDRARAAERYQLEFLQWNDCLLREKDQRKCDQILQRARRR